MFKQSPFGYLLDLPPMRVQSQLIRHLVLKEVPSDQKEMFTFHLNRSVLKFGIAEFKVVIGFKCGTLDDFVHETVGSSQLMKKYFPNNNNDKGVRKDHFIKVFKDESVIEPDDVFHMCIIYCISTIILSSPPNNTYVPEDHFLLVESGKYVDYPWGYLSFLDLRDCITNQMVVDSERVLFSGFPLALQIWFYECCNQVDRTVAIREYNRTPRMFNWRVAKRNIYFSHFKRRMFRESGSQYKFKNMLFTPDDLSAIRTEELDGSSAIGVFTNNEHPPPNIHIGGSEENVGSSNFEANNFEAYERLQKEIYLVRHQLSILEAKVDDQFSEIKIFIEDSFKKFMTETRIPRNGDPKSDNSGLTKTCVANEDNIAKDASVNCGLVNQIPTTFMEAEHNQVEPDCANTKEQCIVDAILSNDGKSILDEFDFPDLTESQFVALENRMPYHTSMQEASAKAIGNFQQSPYTELGEADGSSVKRPAIFKRKHPFDQYANFEVGTDLVDSFQLWIKKKLSKKRGKKQSAFTVASNKINLPFDFGDDRVAQMAWFYDLVTTGRPWGDSHFDVIMYYLRKKMKYGPDNDTRVTFMDSFFIRWVEQIHDCWLKSMKDNRVITVEHEVAQYIRGLKIHGNVPWECVDYICIPINIPELCHWILAVINLRSFGIDVYDSLFEVGSMHYVAVNNVVKKLAEIIPLFFISSGFYKKRSDVNWEKKFQAMDRTFGDPLFYVTADGIPQQCDDSNDCGLYTCAFAEYHSQGQFDISASFIDSYLFRVRYGALLWHYGSQKIDEEAVSESEATGKVVTRSVSPRLDREYIPVSDSVGCSKLVPIKKK